MLFRGVVLAGLVLVACSSDGETSNPRTDGAAARGGTGTVGSGGDAASSARDGGIAAGGMAVGGNAGVAETGAPPGDSAGGSLAAGGSRDAATSDSGVFKCLNEVCDRSQYCKVTNVSSPPMLFGGCVPIPSECASQPSCECIRPHANCAYGLPFCLNRPDGDLRVDCLAS